jgi:hypothetical protein
MNENLEIIIKIIICAILIIGAVFGGMKYSDIQNEKQDQIQNEKQLELDKNYNNGYQRAIFDVSINIPQIIQKNGFIDIQFPLENNLTGQMTLVSYFDFVVGVDKKIEDDGYFIFNVPIGNNQTKELILIKGQRK